MIVSSASVATDRPARYGKQLVAHLTRRAGGEWDEATGTGWLDFGAGTARLVAADSRLDLRLESADPERLESVIGRHLVRFGTKDELAVRWSRDDGTPGTSYRNDDAAGGSEGAGRSEGSEGSGDVDAAG